MNSEFLELLFLIDSVYTFLVFMISVYICSKLNDYYKLTTYEGLKYFKNSFITLISSFIIIYFLKTVNLMGSFSLFSSSMIMKSKLVLLSLLTISILIFIYYYYMTFFFNDILEKNKALYSFLANKRLIFLLAIIAGILVTPAVDILTFLLFCFSFYLVYRKMKISQKRLNYFIIYNLLILSYAINLVQMVLFEIRKYFYLDILIYILQTYIYLKIWNEVKS